MDYKKLVFKIFDGVKGIGQTELMPSVMFVNNYDSEFTASSYRPFVREVFNKNPIAARAIKTKAKVLSSIEICLKNSDGEIIPKHPVLDLVLKKSITTGKNFQEILEQIVIHYELEGDAFVLMNFGDERIKRSQTPIALEVMRPDKVRIKDDVVYYRPMLTADEKKYQLKDVIRISAYNPSSDANGSSAIEPLQASIEMSNSGRKWNISLMKNLMRIGVYFKSPTNAVRSLRGKRSDEAQNEITRKFAGAENVGKTLTLSGGMEVSTGDKTPQDMDWSKSNTIATLEILSALETPPEIVGLSEYRLFSNYAEARKSYYAETIIPFLKKILGKFSDGILQHYKDLNGAYFDIDYKTISHIVGEEDKKRDATLAEYHGGLITLDEARKQRGYEPLTPQQYDQLYTTPVSFSSADNVVADDPFSADLVGFNSAKISFTTSEQKAKGQKRAVDIVTYRRQNFKLIHKPVKDQLKKEGEIFADIIARSDLNGAVQNVEEYIFKHQAEWLKIFKDFNFKVLQNVGQKELDAVLQNLKSGKRFDIYADAITTRVEESVAIKVKRISATTRARLKLLIQDGIDNGLPIRDIAANVGELFGTGSISARAMNIAQTETIGTVNFAALESVKQANIPLLKGWLSNDDGLTRGTDGKDKFDHLSIGREAPIPLEQKFRVSGEEMLYPADQSSGASAGNICHCRCTFYNQTLEKL